MIEPEVAGNIADSTGDWSVHPPTIDTLCYEFDDWLGTEIVTSFPCFIVTDALKVALETIQPTGCQFDSVEVSVSDLFEVLNSEDLSDASPNGGTLPKFHWLKPTGTLMQDDFAQTGIEKGYKLAVSQRVWDVLSKHNMAFCSAEEI